MLSGRRQATKLEVSRSPEESPTDGKGHWNLTGSTPRRPHWSQENWCIRLPVFLSAHVLRDDFEAAKSDDVDNGGRIG